MSEVSGLIKGLHYITLVTANEEVNRGFYTEVLGLRRVKLSVNQDDPYHRHLFYADEKARGNAITFFEWPDLPRGMVGLGSPHHLSYSVRSVDELARWRAWLSSKAVPTDGPHVRDQRASLYLRDPDGVIVEIAAVQTEGISKDYFDALKLRPPLQITPDMRLSTFDHASPVVKEADVTLKFMSKALGLRHSYTKKNPDDEHASILGIGSEEKPDFVRALSSGLARRGFVGVGNIHHIAMSVESDEEQLKILRHLDNIGIKNSGVIDRFWFHSLYFRDPDGNLLEVATKNPGYAVDEAPDALGTRLVLPPWLELRRSEIQDELGRTDSMNAASRALSSYPTIPQPPEKLAVEVA